MDDALKIIEDRLEEIRKLKEDPLKNVTSLSNAAIMRLLKTVLGQCYFYWDSVLYRQKAGLPMGSRLSPIIANIYMEHLEYKVLCSGIPVPKILLRYVDDYFVLWNKKKGSHCDFLTALNSQHKDISLTEEIEVERRLPFLDVAITRPLFGESEDLLEPLQLEIYRKPTSSDRYLHFNSCHPAMLRQNNLKTIWLRGQRILKNFPLQLKKEMDYVKRVFSAEKNGYPIKMIEDCFKRWEKEIRRRPEMLEVNMKRIDEDLLDKSGQQRFVWPTAAARFQTGNDESNRSEQLEERSKKNNEEQPFDPDEMDLEEIMEPERISRSGENVQNLPQMEHKPTMIVPFLPGVGDQLRQIANKHDVRIWYTYPGRTADLFNAYRGKLHQSKSRFSVYKVDCSCGTSYVGESSRNLKVRISEHLKKSSNSAISKHLQRGKEEYSTTGKEHQLILKDTQIIASEKNTLKRKIIESLVISGKSQKLCNEMGSSIELPPIWGVCRQGLEKQLAKFE